MFLNTARTSCNDSVYVAAGPIVEQVLSYIRNSNNYITHRINTTIPAALLHNSSIRGRGNNYIANYINIMLYPLLFLMMCTRVSAQRWNYSGTPRIGFRLKRIRSVQSRPVERDTYCVLNKFTC